MLIRNQWLASIIVLVWVCGALLESQAFGGAGEAGKEIYQKHCQSCHGTDGHGNPKLAQVLKTEIASIATPATLSKPEAEMLKAIAEGKGKMPPFGKVISEQDQRAVLGYVKHLAAEAH